MPSQKRELMPILRSRRENFTAPTKKERTIKYKIGNKYGNTTEDIPSENETKPEISASDVSKSKLIYS